MKLLASVAAIFLFASAALATDYSDYLNPPYGTQPVALMGGDTIATYQVSCSSNTKAAGATLLLAAVNAGPAVATQSAGRPQRKRCFQVTGNEKVAIGSSTVATSDFFYLGESTSTYSTFCDNNTGAVYCRPALDNVTQTVNVLVESQSQP